MMTTLVSETEKLAEPLLHFFVKTAQDIFGERLVSIFKFGSLGSHGGFSLCSDVDVVIMLDQIKQEDQETIQTINEIVKASNLEFSDRLSIFWSSYDDKIFGQGIGRFPPLDRLDFILYGVLLFGVDRRSEFSKPSHEDLVLASAEFISSFMLAGDKFEKLTKYPEKIAAEGARYFTKFVLFPVRLIYTLDHPGMIGSNGEAVEHYNKSWIAHEPEAAEIINMAYALRNTPASSPVSISSDKIKSALLPLYKYCVARYQDSVLAIGNIALAKTLDIEKNRILEALEISY